MVVEYIKCAQTENVREELIKLIEDSYVAAQNQEHFNIGLSGGSLPSLLVSTFEKVTRIDDWKKLRFWFCDERCVSFDDDQSTFGIYRNLIKQLHQTKGPEVVPIGLNQFFTIDPSIKNSKCADDYQSKMRRHFKLSTATTPATSPINSATSPVATSASATTTGLPKFDILFLGVGPDGHTCSLFPNHRLLKETSKWVAYIGDSPKPPPERVTLTYPVVNNAKLCCFVATGKSKAEILKEILVDKKPYPAQLVDTKNGRTIWIVDAEAGSLLP